MATLSDRLEHVVGAKAADPLDEVFGIRTVDDLLRHYPRSYVEGTSVRSADSAGAEPPLAGQHVTLVDEITHVVEKPIRKRPKDKILIVTVGSGRSKVTATFFNPRYLKKGLTEGTKVMLAGEVGFYKGAMQLTHPAFLILDSPDGRNRGSRSLTASASTLSPRPAPTRAVTNSPPAASSKSISPIPAEATSGATISTSSPAMPSPSPGSQAPAQVSAASVAMRTDPCLAAPAARAMV